MGGNMMRSDLTCNNNNNYDGSGGFVPRKRARVGDAAACLVADGRGALLPAGNAQTSTSGRPSSAAPASHDLLSHLYRHGVETDTFIRLENERLRAGLEEARRRHVRAVLSAVERVAAQRLRAAESEPGRALGRNAELGEKLQQMGAEGQAWQGVAQRHEAVVAGLRATIDQLLKSPCGGAEGEGEAEDAQSCCFEQEEEGAGGRSRGKACRSCREADACVLLLPCRHLCLCGGCEAAVEACPVCAATKNASLHVLLS